MAEITNDLIYEVLKSMQSRLERLDDSVGEIKIELTAIRGYVSAMAVDVSNIYVRLGDHDDRLARIETRLGLLDPAH
ncbi:hypothetical protein [Brevundimonas sp.]|uniref:hypothetical protein n=1 Tax=Brevundimonas sp. TaxID=1871086 RepID=UPI002ED7D91E